MAGFILIVIAAFFFPGIILRSKSIASGRKGPGLLQPLRDIVVLLKKGSVFSTSTGIIFRIAPAVTLATVLCAMMLLPFADHKALLSFEGDFVLFAYLLALGKFFTVIAALDTGSSFEGMGASREAFFSLLVEPAFFILLATFAMFTGYTSFSVIFNHFFITGNDYVMIYSIIGIYLFTCTSGTNTTHSVCYHKFAIKYYYHFGTKLYCIRQRFELPSYLWLCQWF